MANRASLVLRRLIMEIRGPRSVAERGARVALQAEDIEVAGLEKMWIGGAVRRMTRFAAFRLDRLVLENEGSLLVGVARKANGIPRCSRPKLLPDEASMGVMTIRALHQAFLHTMVERHIKLCFLVQMAGVAEFRLRLG